MADKKEPTTEEKAEKIGKDIGVEKDELPEYDIKAEEDTPSEQVVEDDKKEDPEDDKPLAKEKEEKVSTSKEKRLARKKRLAQKFDAKDRIIREQQEQLNALAGRLNEVDGKLSNYDKSQLDGAVRETQGILANAEKAYKDAFNGGNADGATAAMAQMYDAKERLKYLSGIAARQQAPQQPKKPTMQVEDPVIANKAQQWASENPWYKADASDEDSAIAQTVSVRLISEGYDPTSEDYWEEFNDRLSKRGIGQKREDDEYEEEEEKPKPRAKSPPVGGGSGRGDIKSKQVITLPTALINSMKESGAWDDPKRKHKIIKEHQRVRAEQEAEARGR